MTTITLTINIDDAELLADQSDNPSVLAQLAAHEDSVIRYRVSRNPAASRETRALLADDDDGDDGRASPGDDLWS